MRTADWKCVNYTYFRCVSSGIWMLPSVPSLLFSLLVLQKPVKIFFTLENGFKLLTVFTVWLNISIKYEIQHSSTFFLTNNINSKKKKNKPKGKNEPKVELFSAMSCINNNFFFPSILCRNRSRQEEININVFWGHLQE